MISPFYLDLSEIEDATLLGTLVDLMEEKRIGNAHQIRSLVGFYTSRSVGYLAWENTKEGFIGWTTNTYNLLGAKKDINELLDDLAQI